MEHSPSCEANRFSASQEILRILWNPSVHYRIYKCPTCPYPEPDRSSPCLPPSNFLKIHLNIPSMPGSPQLSLSPRLPHQILAYTSPLPPHTCYMPSPSHSSRFDHPYNIGWGVQIIQLFVMQFSLLPRYLVPLSPTYSSQFAILIHPQPTFLPQCERPSFTPIQNNRQSYSSVYLDL